MSLKPPPVHVESDFRLPPWARLDLAGALGGLVGFVVWMWSIFRVVDLNERYGRPAWMPPGVEAALWAAGPPFIGIAVGCLLIWVHRLFVVRRLRHLLGCPACGSHAQRLSITSLGLQETIPVSGLCLSCGARNRWELSDSEARHVGRPESGVRDPGEPPRKTSLP
ncbi:MAG: hypothetical protein NTX64_04795 [Elusimicrobia bacterium]|nr:hypothetical protein [Elusimicrobiota bacterium]